MIHKRAIAMLFVISILFLVSIGFKNQNDPPKEEEVVIEEIVVKKVVVEEVVVKKLVVEEEAISKLPKITAKGLSNLFSVNSFFL